MKSFLATLLLSLVAATANAAFITYDVNRSVGEGTVIGTITTDGTLGVLGELNIEDWSFTPTSQNLNGSLPDTTTDVISLGQAGADMILRGASVSATATQLLFDFDKPGTNFLFLSGGSQNFWCLETTVCVDDGINKTEVIGKNISGTTVAELESRTGVVPFANAAVIPVPAAAWLFGSGLLGLIGLVRIRR